MQCNEQSYCHHIYALLEKCVRNMSMESRFYSELFWLHQQSIRIPATTSYSLLPIVQFKICMNIFLLFWKYDMTLSMFCLYNLSYPFVLLSVHCMGFHKRISLLCHCYKITLDSSGIVFNIIQPHLKRISLIFHCCNNASDSGGILCFLSLCSCSTLFNFIWRKCLFSIIATRLL